MGGDGLNGRIHKKYYGSDSLCKGEGICGKRNIGPYQRSGGNLWEGGYGAWRGS